MQSRVNTIICQIGMLYLFRSAMKHKSKTNLSTIITFTPYALLIITDHQMIPQFSKLFKGISKDIQYSGNQNWKYTSYNTCDNESYRNRLLLNSRRYSMKRDINGIYEPTGIGRHISRF